MRAAICTKYGPPDVVEVGEIPAPPLEAGHVRIKVAAAAVNFPDVLIVANQYQVKVPTPFVPGSELAGEVVEVAGDVDGMEPGTRVFGTTFVGAFAEEAVIPASSVTRTPPGVDDSHAAAFGVAHRTAYHVLRSVAELKPGEELVVLGAGGGVGLAAVQLGSVLGARVTAVASSDEKLEVARAEGAEVLVNHRRQKIKEVLPGGADVVVDPVGGALSELALRSLRWGGRFVTVGYASGEIPRIPLNLVLLKGVHILGFEFRSFATNRPMAAESDERELMELFAEGRISPHIGAVFPLEEASAALGHVANGGAVGKVVIAIPSS